jgi:hypothetical protein
MPAPGFIPVCGKTNRQIDSSDISRRASPQTLHWVEETIGHNP